MLISRKINIYFSFSFYHDTALHCFIFLTAIADCLLIMPNIFLRSVGRLSLPPKNMSVQDKGRQLCIAARSHCAKQRQMCKNVTSILLERGINAEGGTLNSWLLPLLTSEGLNLKETQMLKHSWLFRMNCWEICQSLASIRETLSLGVFLERVSMELKRLQAFCFFLIGQQTGAEKVVAEIFQTWWVSYGLAMATCFFFYERLYHVKM